MCNESILAKGFVAHGTSHCSLTEHSGESHCVRSTWSTRETDGAGALGERVGGSVSLTCGSGVAGSVLLSDAIRGNRASGVSLRLIVLGAVEVPLGDERGEELDEE